MDLPINSNTPMLNFYCGKCALVTGATGFIGQLIVEKLLRCGVRKVYVLARSKKGVSGDFRIAETFKGPPFQNLLKTDPNFMNRVHVIHGNLQDLDIGLSPDDKCQLIEDVDFVIHAAADVRFQDPLANLIVDNLRGTREMLELTSRMSRVKAFIYISTSYSQSPNKVIKEEFYEPPLDPEIAIRFVEICGKVDNEVLEVLTERIIFPWPNSYTYTKAITERLVQQYGDKFPVAVLRPSIIVATNSDPIPGWFSNIYGPTGLMIAGAHGLILTMPQRPNYVMDIIPADFVVNTTLAVVWNTVQNRNSDPQVYHVVSSTDKPLTQKEILSKMEKRFHENPFKNSIRNPHSFNSEFAILHAYFIFVHHILPYFLFDLIQWISRKPVRLLKVYRKIYKMIDGYVFFSTGQWTFHTQKIRQIYDKMTVEDRKIFPSDVRSFDWDKFTHDYYNGIKLYFTKETLEVSQNSLAKMKILFVLQYVYNILIYSATAFLILKISGFC